MFGAGTKTMTPSMQVITLITKPQLSSCSLLIILFLCPYKSCIPLYTASQLQCHGLDNSLVNRGYLFSGDG